MDRWVFNVEIIVQVKSKDCAAGYEVKLVNFKILVIMKPPR